MHVRAICKVNEHYFAEGGWNGIVRIWNWRLGTQIQRFIINSPTHYMHVFDLCMLGSFHLACVSFGNSTNRTNGGLNIRSLKRIYMGNLSES
jgi:hypothetical protein